MTKKVIDANKPNWIKVLKEAYNLTIDDFGKQVFGDLTKSVKSVKMPVYDVYSEEVQNYIDNTVGEKVVEISDTSKARLKMMIDEGITEGLSIAKIASFINMLYLDQIIPNRSLVIAQTEIIGAANYGSYSAALQSGADVLKMWLPTYDQRTRDSHLAMSYHPPIELEDKFNVNGSKMKYPGDPNGAASEVIRCRCTIIYKRKE